MRLRLHQLPISPCGEQRNLVHLQMSPAMHQSENVEYRQHRHLFLRLSYPSSGRSRRNKLPQRCVKIRRPNGLLLEANFTRLFSLFVSNLYRGDEIFEFEMRMRLHQLHLAKHHRQLEDLRMRLPEFVLSRSEDGLCDLHMLLPGGSDSSWSLANLSWFRKQQ